MNTLIICLILAMLLPYIAKMPVAIAMQKAGGYNNQYPREQQAKLKGFGARSFAGHQNSFESLTLFSAAVLTALATQHTSVLIQNLAITHIVLRCFYHTFYLLNWATLRSTVWFFALLCCFAIMWLCL